MSLLGWPKRRKERQKTQQRCGVKVKPLHYDASDAASRNSLLTKTLLMQWKNYRERRAERVVRAMEATFIN
jgi:hypothetical protein